MAFDLQVSSRLIALVLFTGISDGFAYRIEQDSKPLVDERFSINGNNESTVSREVINHVRHKHEQTVGNVHILTNIDIANLITILNVSTPLPIQSTTSGPINDYSTERSALGHERRPEQHRDVNYRPFKFPTSVSEESRHIRWPSERRNDAFDEQTAAVNLRPIVVFPRSESNGDNELPTAEIDNVSAPTVRPNINGQTEQLVANSVSLGVVNETAIANGMQPLIYIDDDGIFQVKYLPARYVSSDDQHSLTSINKAEETAIISNDNQQISVNREMDGTTIDFVHDDAINNEMLFQWSADTSVQPQADSNLFNGRPIFT